MPSASLERPPRTSRIALLLGSGVITLAALLPLRYAFFSGFQEYDDEGYLLVSLRDYARGVPLYDELYSQYGPLYYQVVTLLFRGARLPFTHTGGRMLAVALLLASVALLALATYRFTRHVPVTLAAQLLLIQALLPGRNEPLHPGALLAVLLGGLAVAASFFDGPRRRWAGLAIGVLLAGMLLVKVNVGGFALIAVGCALLTGAPPRRAPAATRVLAGTTAGLLPVALMAPHWNEPTVRAYVAVVLGAVLGLLAVSWRWRVQPSAGSPAASLATRPMALAGLLTCVVSTGWEMARGTTAKGLLEGVLVGPSRHAGGFFFAPELGPVAAALALCGVAGAVLVAWARSRGVADQPTGVVIVGLVQMACGALIWLAVAERLPIAALGLAPPLLWSALVGRCQGSHPLGPPLLAWLAALQALHAYPVAGTQVAWSTLLTIPVGGLAIAAGWRGVADGLRASAGAALGPRLGSAVLSGGLLAMSAGGFYTMSRQLQHEYTRAVPLGLPGAEAIRVPGEQAQALGFLVQAISSRCRTFVTQPGINSLYLFTGFEPPTHLNTTVWMILLSDDQQERIVQRLEAAPPPVCALRRQRRAFSTPLARYIEERFVTLFTFDFFEFRVRRDSAPRSLAPA